VKPTLCEWQGAAALFVDWSRGFTCWSWPLGVLNIWRISALIKPQLASNVPYSGFV